MPDKPKCFVMMPISTPESYAIEFKNPNHFHDILKYLHTPAIEKAGYEVVSPISKGSEIIHSDIVKNISECDLVLCDMSGLNQNVFFEFGIRCALNKPVALVVDDITEKTQKIPFDIGMINRHKYLSVPGYKANEEIDKIVNHILDSVEKSDGKNALWRYYGISDVGNFKPNDSSIDEKLNYLVSKVSSIQDNYSYSGIARVTGITANDIYKKIILDLESLSISKLDFLRKAEINEFYDLLKLYISLDFENERDKNIYYDRIKEKIDRIIADRTFT